MPGHKPTITQAHYGATARRTALVDGLEASFKQAKQIREQELKRSMTRQERRDFKRGWHLGLLHYGLGELQAAGRYLKNEEVEVLGNSVYKLARELGFALSLPELDALSKQRKKKDKK